MYSGKSKELFRQLERYVYARKKVVLVRPKRDSRDYLMHKSFMDDNAGSDQNVKVPSVIVSCFEETQQQQSLFEKSDAIFVDEYFMIKDCIKFIENYGREKDIFFAGLLATSSCTLFDETVKILPYCDKIIKLNAVCMNCGSQLGNYSYFNGEKAKTEDILVGDKEYKALCLNCYKKSTGDLKQGRKELPTSYDEDIKVSPPINE